MSGLKNLFSIKNRKVGFTLAEVLITLGIIGVVAALTIPSIIQDYRDKATVARVKKIYTVLSNAYVMAQTEFDSANTWVPADPEISQAGNNLWFERITKYMKLQRDLGQNLYRKAFPQYKNFNGKNGNYAMMRNGLLEDGTQIMFGSFMPDGSKWWGNYGFIYVDINATRRPLNKQNMVGKDVFIFQLYDGTSSWGKNVPPKLLPVGFQNPENCIKETCDNPDRQKCGGGFNCTAWVIKYENLDYLRCRQKLLEKGTHSCKE